MTLFILFVLFLLFLGNSTLVSVAIASIDWSRWHMLHMTIVLERAVLILTLDVTIDELHQQVFVQIESLTKKGYVLRG